MKVNIIRCQDDNEVKEIVSLLKEKYKGRKDCKFREISDTFILPDKKWVVVPQYLMKVVHKEMTTDVYPAEVIKNALSVK